MLPKIILPDGSITYKPTAAQYQWLLDQQRKEEKKAITQISAGKVQQVLPQISYTTFDELYLLFLLKTHGTESIRDKLRQVAEKYGLKGSRRQKRLYDEKDFVKNYYLRPKKRHRS